MKCYNAGVNDRHRRMDYAAWVEDLRLPLEGRRLQITNAAFDRLGGGDSITCAQAKEAFAFEGFDAWCAAIGIDQADENASITRDQFLAFYADISMGCFEDNKYIKLVEDTWCVVEPGHCKVDPKNVEALINAVRHNLVKFGNARHSEEYLLRELFRQFDRDSNGSLTLTELKGMLEMINITADEAHLTAFLNKLDTNGNGCLEFEEFVTFMVHDRFKCA